MHFIVKQWVLAWHGAFVFIVIIKSNLFGYLLGLNPLYWHFLCPLNCLQMGNPFLDIDISISNDEFLWSHGLISDETYQLTQSMCNNSKRWRETYVLNNLSEDCQYVLSKVKSETRNINLEDVTLGLCPKVGGSQTTRSTKPRKFLHQVSHLRIINAIWCWNWLINMWWHGLDFNHYCFS